MKQYLEALRFVLDNGEELEDRTGVGTLSVFGYQMRFNLREGFPAVTTKKLAFKACVSELLWFLSGSGNERELCDILHGSKHSSYRTIWTDNYENNGYAPSLRHPVGDLGPIYGVQWRSFLGLRNGRDIDQISEVIESIKKDPHSRRHIVTAWNPAEIEKMALPPCHLLFQFYVSKTGHLSCQLYQRSADMFLGVPFNIASYSLLTHLVARECGLKVGEFIWTGGDCHIYRNHIEQVKEQLSRSPRELPSLVVDTDNTDIFDYLLSDFKLEGYDPMPSIKARMAV